MSCLTYPFTNNYSFFFFGMLSYLIYNPQGICAVACSSIRTCCDDTNSVLFIHTHVCMNVTRQSEELFENFPITTLPPKPCYASYWTVEKELLNSKGSTEWNSLLCETPGLSGQTGMQVITKESKSHQVWEEVAFEQSTLFVKVALLFFQKTSKGLLGELPEDLQIPEGESFRILFCYWISAVQSAYTIMSICCLSMEENCRQIACSQTRGQKAGNLKSYRFPRHKTEAVKDRDWGRWDLSSGFAVISLEDFSSLLPAGDQMEMWDHKHSGKVT